MPRLFVSANAGRIESAAKCAPRLARGLAAASLIVVVVASPGAWGQEDESYIRARVDSEIDVRDAAELVGLRAAAMEARLEAVDAGLDALSRTEREDVLGFAAAAAEAADSHPQEVLEIVAAATADAADDHPQEVLEIVAAATADGDGSASALARGVAERLRHRDRAVSALDPRDLSKRVDDLADEAGERRRNRDRDRREVAELELEADRLERSIAGIEEALRVVRKRPGRLTY